MRFRCQNCNSMTESDNVANPQCTFCRAMIDLDSDVVKDQLERSYPEMYADKETEPLTKKGWIGIMMIIVGAGITWWSYVQAAPGENYVIWWGLCAYGFYLAVLSDR